MELLTLKSKLESLEHKGKKMFQRELLSIEMMEQLESQSEVEDISGSSGSFAPVEISDEFMEVINSLPSDWSPSLLLGSNDGTLSTSPQGF